MHRLRVVAFRGATAWLAVMTMACATAAAAAAATPMLESQQRYVHTDLLVPGVRQRDVLHADAVAWLAEVVQEQLRRGVNISKACDTASGRTYVLEQRRSRFPVCQPAGQAEASSTTVPGAAGAQATGAASDHRSDKELLCSSPEFFGWPQAAAHDGSSLGGGGEAVDRRAAAAAASDAIASQPFAVSRNSVLNSCDLPGVRSAKGAGSVRPALSLCCAANAARLTAGGGGSHNDSHASEPLAAAAAGHVPAAVWWRRAVQVVEGSAVRSACESPAAIVVEHPVLLLVRGSGSGGTLSTELPGGASPSSSQQQPHGDGDDPVAATGALLSVFTALAAADLPEVRQWGVQVLIADGMAAGPLSRSLEAASFPYSLRDLSLDPLPSGTCLKLALVVHVPPSGGLLLNARAGCYSPLLVAYSRWLRALHWRLLQGQPTHHPRLHATESPLPRSMAEAAALAPTLAGLQAAAGSTMAGDPPRRAYVLWAPVSTALSTPRGADASLAGASHGNGNSSSAVDMLRALQRAVSQWNSGGSSRRCGGEAKVPVASASGTTGARTPHKAGQASCEGTAGPRIELVVAAPGWLTAGLSLSDADLAQLLSASVVVACPDVGSALLPYLQRPAHIVELHCPLAEPPANGGGGSGLQLLAQAVDVGFTHVVSADPVLTANAVEAALDELWRTWCSVRGGATHCGPAGSAAQQGWG